MCCLLDQPRDNTHGLSQLHAPATANHSGDLQGFRYEAVRCRLGLQASSTDVRQGQRSCYSIGCSWSCQQSTSQASE
jgi:hypothetical protein